MSNAFTAKDLETLRVMNTPAADWTIPPIRWEIREVMVADRSTCARQVRTAEGWKTCDRCDGTGTRITYRKQKMEVGIVLWPTGTEFRSHRGGDCGLCGKRIKYSNLLPLMNQAEDGSATVGMWVGCDCASKFSGVPVIKAYDNQEGLRLVRSADLPKRPARPAELANLEEIARMLHSEERSLESKAFYAGLDLERGQGAAEQVQAAKEAHAASKTELRAAVRAVKDPYKAAIVEWEAECARIRAAFV